MPNYGYHFARAEGSLTRRIYRLLLPAISRRPVAVCGEIPLNVFAYSGEEQMPEQVASIRSFLKYSGRPKRFTVVSDGTHSRDSLALLSSLDPSVAVSQAPPLEATQWPSNLYSYLRNHPTGKQLALIMQLPVDGPTMYVDSDVLFFPGAADLKRLVIQDARPAFYLADCRLSADLRLFRSAEEKVRPVNTGVLLLFEKIDWALSINRFLELQEPPNFFTNQTMTHLAMHTNGALPFDESKYILQLDDQFAYGDHHVSHAVALRHYVNPVRHKFWTRLARRVRQ